jgi:hypothetical protein
MVVATIFENGATIPVLRYWTLHVFLSLRTEFHDNRIIKWLTYSDVLTFKMAAIAIFQHGATLPVLRFWTLHVFLSLSLKMHQNWATNVKFTDFNWIGFLSLRMPKGGNKAPLGG